QRNIATVDVDTIRPINRLVVTVVNRQTSGVQRAVASRHTIDVNVVVQGDRHFGVVVTAGFGYSEVVVATEGDLAVGADVVGAGAIGNIPARIRNAADLLELIFGRRLARGDRVGIKGGIGQPPNDTGI